MADLQTQPGNNIAGRRAATMKDYNVIVIGGGSPGFVQALHALDALMREPVGVVPVTAKK